MSSQCSSSCGVYLVLDPPLEMTLVVSAGVYLVLEPPKNMTLTACQGYALPGVDPDPEGEFDYLGVDSCHFGLGCYPLAGLK